MRNIQAIITHPGSAHKDEFLACSILVALNQVPIYRREPSEEDLRNASVCVVDVGLRHQPELLNFDHHQFPKDQVPTCSLSLVLQNLGIYPEARAFCEWLEVAEWFDCRGPVDTARWLGVDRTLLSRLNSPIEISLLKRFSQCSSLEPGQALWELLKMVGSDLLEYINGLHNRLLFLQQHAEIWSLETHGARSQVLYIPRTDPLPEDPSFGIERFVDQMPPGHQIVATVYPDRRGSGYGLSRFRDHPRFDFLRIAEEPGVHFAHARGFMAKTSHSHPELLKALLQKAAVPA